VAYFSTRPSVDATDAARSGTLTRATEEWCRGSNACERQPSAGSNPAATASLGTRPNAGLVPSRALAASGCGLQLWSRLMRLCGAAGGRRGGWPGHCVCPPPADHPTVLIASIIESAPKLISGTSISRRGIADVYQPGDRRFDRYRLATASSPPLVGQLIAKALVLFL
jgi:hypothetical protein